VPAHHRVGLDDYEVRPLGRPAARQRHPEEPVAEPQRRASSVPRQDIELVAKCEVFEHEVAPVADDRAPEPRHEVDTSSISASRLPARVERRSDQVKLGADGIKALHRIEGENPA
jgi:hypothetical protein